MQRHHYYRKNNPYPDSFNVRETPEIKILAQILGIIDYYDAASTRINSRTQTSKIEAFFGGGFQSQKRIKQGFIEEYAEQHLSYNGKWFRHINITGKEFIEGMYKLKIFGRKNRLNPFVKLFG